DRRKRGQQRARNGGYHKQRGRQQHYAAAAIAVSQFARNGYADDASDERRGNEPALLKCRKRKLFDDERQYTGNNSHVETEQEAAQRRNDAGEQQDFTGFYGVLHIHLLQRLSLPWPPYRPC